MKDFLLKYFSRLLAVIGCGTLVTACYGVPYEKFSTKVSCTVVDADNGAPIKGIQVRMTMGYRPSAGDNTVQGLVPIDEPVNAYTGQDGKVEEYLTSYSEPDCLMIECLDIDGADNGSYVPSSGIYRVEDAGDLEITLENIDE